MAQLDGLSGLQSPHIFTIFQHHLHSMNVYWMSLEIRKTRRNTTTPFPVRSGVLLNELSRDRLMDEPICLCGSYRCLSREPQPCSQSWRSLGVSTGMQQLESGSQRSSLRTRVPWHQKRMYFIIIIISIILLILFIIVVIMNMIIVR